MLRWWYLLLCERCRFLGFLTKAGQHQLSLLKTQQIFLSSKGEKIIRDILLKNNIDFEEQKTFETCRFLNTKAKARFDFYLPNDNLLIEYDGE